MSKPVTIIIIVGILVAGGLATLAFTFAGPRTQTADSSTNQNVGLPTAASVPQPNSLATGSGGTSSTVQTNNFITDPTTVKDPINTGYYYLGYHVSEGVPDPTATANPPYIITYISTTHYFNIALLQEPIGSVRLQAEQYLMNRLGITQAQMCQLDYMVSVPDRVNSQFSGLNLGFSFCPGATVLPQ